MPGGSGDYLEQSLLGSWLSDVDCVAANVVYLIHCTDSHISIGRLAPRIYGTHHLDTQ